MTKKNSLLVPAGGAGSRLKPLVSDVPKTLAPVDGKPFIYFLLKEWVTCGLENFTFVLHHDSDKIIAYLDHEQKYGLLQNCLVSYVIEPTPLGTGGAVAYAVKTLGISDSFLLTNSDTWLGSSIKALFHTSPECMGIVRVANSSRYGKVTIDQDKVTSFAEKHSEDKEGLINAGIYHLTPDLFKQWDGKAFSLEKETLSQLVIAKKLDAVLLDVEFIDIGIPEDYLLFCQWISSKKKCTL